MEEDEEVVMKHSALYNHLLDVGFNNFETIENEKFKPVRSVEIQNEKIESNSINNVEEIEENIHFEHLVYRILTCDLIFNDDVAIVKHFTVLKKSKAALRSKSYKCWCQISAVSFLPFSCTCCAFRFSNWIYFVVGLTPLCIFAGNYLRRLYTEYKERNVIEGLTKSLKNLSLMFQKCIRFIQESEIMEFNSISRNRIKKSILSSQLENVDIKYKQINQLRFVVHNTLRSAILNLKNKILTLVNEFPLKESVASFNFYLAFLDENELHCCDQLEESISTELLQKMKYVHLLLQSEFLKLLCLNFNPALWIYPLQKRNIFRLIEELSVGCAQQYVQLKDIFLVYYTIEKPYNPNEKITANTNWAYKEVYLKICSVSVNLQSVLRKSRDIEEVLENSRLESEKCDMISKLDFMSEDLLNNYLYCNRVLEDFRKYVLHLKPKDISEKNITPFLKGQEPGISEKQSILIGASDFNPRSPDEIFVGVSTDNNKNEPDDCDTDCIVSHKCSEMLISELKIALQDKAQERKERERAALKNKNLEDDVSDCENKIENVEIDKNKLKIESTSESDEELDEHFKSRPFILPVGSTFAETIAQASSHWGLKFDDYVVGDDSDSDS